MHVIVFRALLCPEEASYIIKNDYLQLRKYLITLPQHMHEINVFVVMIIVADNK